MSSSPASSDSVALRNDRRSDGPPLRDRVLYVPRMSFSAAQCFTAALRSFGLDARPFPPSDAETLELGGRFTSGEECFPERVTLGDALKVVLAPGAKPERVAFFMPGAPGPCRFGQYAPFLRRILDSVGAHDAMVLSPTSGTGYGELEVDSGGFQRAGWRALVVADLLRKALLRVRPYEREPGATDAAHQAAVDEACGVLETPHESAKLCLQALRAVMERAAARFAAIPRHAEDRLLIGVVGEIFCRLNTFSNEELIRKLEEQGGEAWISDITEWVYYTNLEQRTKWLPYAGQRWSKQMLVAYLKDRFQRQDEHALIEPFHALFAGREEPPRMAVVTDFAEPYLPADGVYGEMVLNTGKAVYLWSKGCDGVIDISPFTCMNGIVSEAIYPKISRDHDSIPIRIFYFDGTQSHLERDLGIFLELARTYRQRRQRSGERSASRS
jgi:predicted nucleotide-binding protein (sugar kinase/HSP70/actin superfamily)